MVAAEVERQQVSPYLCSADPHSSCESVAYKSDMPGIYSHLLYSSAQLSTALRYDTAEPVQPHTTTPHLRRHAGPAGRVNFAGDQSP